MEHNQKKNKSLHNVSVVHQQHAPLSVGQYALILNWYKINGKHLLGEEELTELHISTLLNALGNPIWNDIYHCWAIEIKQMPDLQGFINHKFNPDRFMYFIEAYHNT